MKDETFENWANFYDLIYSDYAEDIRFYVEEAKKAKGRVLEIACGTGRIYLEMLREGVDAYGIDVSKNMINYLEDKAEKLDLKPKVKKADMKYFRFKYRFSLVTIPFRSFLHNLTTKEQLQTLECVRKHLKKDGKLILNFFYPDHELITKTYGKNVRRTINSDGTKYVLLNRSYFLDESDQIVVSHHTLKNNKKIVWSDKLRLALVYKREFELLLRLAGFSRWKLYGGFNYEPHESYKQEMVWIVEK